MLRTVGDPSTWVATIRVWNDVDPPRVRVFVGTSDGTDVEQFVGSSIDECCAALAAYLRARTT
jgi:hypothetical protein